VTIYGKSFISLTTANISSLYPTITDYTMNGGRYVPQTYSPFISLSLFPSTKSKKVSGRVGANLLIQLHGVIILFKV
jgi:hypothetical protein